MAPDTGRNLAAGLAPNGGVHTMHPPLPKDGQPPADMPSLVVTSTALVALVLLILGIRSDPVYDEPDRLETVRLLHERGLTTAFLREMPHAPGPLHTIILYLTEGLTGLEPFCVRLVNVAFLFVVVFVLYHLLRIIESATPAASASSIIASPMTWVISGLALSEISSMFFATLALLLIGLAANEKRTVAIELFLSAAAGLALALAILGRQPFLVMLLAVPVLVYTGHLRLMSAVVLGVVAVAPPAAVFFIWGGLVPPKVATVGAGISVSHGILSFSYAAILMLIWAPRWYGLRWQFHLAILIAAVAVNAALGLIVITPMLPVATRLLPGFGLTLYTWAASGVFLSLAVMFLASAVDYLRSAAGYSIFICVAVLFLLGTSLKVTGNFSSRYPATFTPFLILLADRQVQPGQWRATRLLAGALLGVLVLVSYLC
jgi:hypothetical protein